MARNPYGAYRYLAPARNGFWEWSDGGHVITWRDGTTIAFQAEIETILEKLVPHGFPPIDAIVLLLAACRTGWMGSDEEFLRKGVFTVEMLAGLQTDRRFGDIVTTLDRVAQLPLAARDTIQRKADLAVTIFEGAQPLVTADDAASILQELRNGLPREFLLDQHHNKPFPMLERLAPLAAGAGRIDAVRLALREKTGLEQLPSVKPAEAPVTESIQALLQRLALDEELGGMVRLARNLTAALTLPRSVSEQQDLPLGGVSDITNRGSLDRLLVSELAHDDATFTVRVALNEALYLRREAPPNVPPKRRLVLVDAGLRMWGLPRVFATAATLALSATRRRRDEFAVFRPHGANLDHVDTTTREGLIAHLAALETHAAPTAALPTFRRLAVDGEGVGEAILITGEDVLEDKAFRHALDEMALPVLYLVTVNRDGRLRLSRRTGQGTKLLREANYRLSDILTPEPTITPLINPKIDPKLPAILRLREFPLLLSHHVEPSRAWSDGASGMFSLTDDRRLMHWTGPNRGAKQISDKVVNGNLLWYDARPGPDRYRVAVVGRLSQHGLALLRIDVEQLACAVIPLLVQLTHVQGVSGHAGAVFVMLKNQVEVFAQSNGQPLQTLPLPPQMKWDRGRFFHDRNGWYALAFNGNTVQFETVCTKRRFFELDLVGLFECSGVDGPIGVTRRGEFLLMYDLDSKSGPRNPQSPGMILPILPQRDNQSYGLGGVSIDGYRVLLTTPEPLNSSRGVSALLLDLRNGQVHADTSQSNRGLESAGLPRFSFESLRKKSAAICVDYSGNVGFLTLTKPNSDQGAEITLFVNYRELNLTTRQINPASRRIRFKPTSPLEGTGYRLGVAEWEDGSRAYFDSRGLLHLKSSDPAIPELTLVLCVSTKRGVAGWCSDGRVWGSEYFVGDVERTDPAVIYNEVLQKFLARLR